MGFNKKKGISTVAVILVLAIFNAFAFLVPFKHTLTFWLGYSFATVAAVLMLASLLFLFNSSYKEKMFLRLPLVKLAWVYFILQTGLGVWEITGFSSPYLPSLIINSCLTGFFVIALLASSAAGESIEKQDEHIAQKTLFLKNIQDILASIKTTDDELSEKIKKLSEDVRFSDPMSHSMLSELEQQIEAKVVMLKSEITDKEKATESIECISDLLSERNRKCKLYKNVKEETPDEDNSGVKYVATTIGILGAIVTIALVVCFIIIPNNVYQAGMSLYENGEFEEAIIVFESLDGFSDSDKMVIACETGIKDKKYDDAQKLFENEDYDAAIIAFKDLGDYKDSNEMVTACETGIKDKKYDEAQKLLREKKYDDAKAAFESLGNYKDSKEMIESINQIIIENKYERAESYFNSQNYVEAIKLYKELGDYKDSKQKIEKIKNRLATEDVLYYGSYENEPIAWQEIKTENNRMLLIAKDSVCDLPYNDEIKNIQWSESSLESWLNDEFINAFSEDQLSSIVAEDVDGVKSKVFLLGENDIVNIENTTVLNSNKDWWLCTKAEAETNAMFVTKNGELNREGESVVRAKGVRPCIWIEL